MKRCYIWLSLMAGLVFSSTRLSALHKDSLHPAKPPRHYFNTMIYADGYSTGKRTFVSNKDALTKRLKSYQVNQATLGFNIPLFTQDFYNKDSTQISNLHFLLTGSFVSLSPNFTGISEHHLSLASVGFRMIYNTGKKGIFFADLSPFATHDRGYAGTGTFRLSSTLLYNYTASQNFSFRVGYTHSYLYGRSRHFPYIGIRVGRIDKINLSVQFPRSISFTVPIGQYVKTSLFTRPQGGQYSFANVDSLSANTKNQRIYFGRYELLSGFRLDVLPSKHFSFYLSGGLTTRNYIAFYEGFAGTKKINDIPLQRVGGSLFVNFGLVLRFGKTRSMYNNQQMYNALDMNNSIDGNNVQPGNGNITRPVKKVKNVKPGDVQDLVDTQDLY